MLEGDLWSLNWLYNLWTEQYTFWKQTVDKEPVLKGYESQRNQFSKTAMQSTHKILYTQTKENIILTKVHTLNDVLCQISVS